MVTGPLLHVSDLHTGSSDRDLEDVAAALDALVSEIRPRLVIATGDLTHRNTRAQHERAATFLRSLGPPVIAVPGNHDLPALPPGRLTRPFGAFAEQWEGAEPTLESSELVVCGLNSVRPWLYQEGLLRSRQLKHVEQTMLRAGPGALRVVVLHHHLTSAPWRATKRPLFGRSRALARLSSAGVELVLSGHVHQASAAASGEFQWLAGDSSLVLATAPGIGRPRPGRPAEVRGLQVCRANDATIELEVHAWRQGAFHVVAEHRYPRRPLTRSGGTAAVDDLEA